MSKIHISVITPVYNAAPFVEKAVISALQFDEVKEVVLIEDGSKDDSLAVCKSLVQKYERVKLFQHPNGENRGAGESRNVGITKASSEFVAFLDADDFYLPNRFDVERLKLIGNCEIDGVYGALGIHFYNEQVLNMNLLNQSLTTINYHVPPEELKWVLINVHPKTQGHFHLDTLTVKKRLLMDVGMFEVDLRLHQDTDLIMKLALKGKLISGNITEAVAVRGVHLNNRITKVDSYKTDSKILLYDYHLNWCLENKIESDYFEAVKIVHKCYVFLNNGPKGILSSLFFLLRNKGVFLSNRRSVMIIAKAKTSEQLKSIILKIKEKIVLTFFRESKTV